MVLLLNTTVSSLFVFIKINNQALVLTSYEINLFLHSEIIYQLIESVTKFFSYIGSQNQVFSIQFKLTVQMFILVELYHVYSTLFQFF